MDWLGGMHVLVGMPQSKSAAMSPDTAGAGNQVDLLTRWQTSWRYEISHHYHNNYHFYWMMQKDQIEGFVPNFHFFLNILTA